MLLACAEAPKKVVTHQLGSYSVVKVDIPELANVKHVFVKAAARLNALKFHLLRASLYRKQLPARFETRCCLIASLKIRLSLSEGLARMVIMQRGIGNVTTPYCEHPSRQRRRKSRSAYRHRYARHQQAACPVVGCLPSARRHS